MKAAFKIVSASMFLLATNAVSAQKIDLLNSNCQNTISCSVSTDGENGKTPAIPVKQGEFNIIVDPKVKPVNFISSLEKYYRSQIKKVDTTVFSLIIPDWKKLSSTQKLNVMEDRKTDNEVRADAEHKANNINHQLIYMANNTNYDIALQMQDNSFMGVLEARISLNNWRSVQYITFSTCGNSYLLKHIAPGSNAYFITPLLTGNYKTTLRYKISGRDKFYYSNEFEGNINYCDLYDTKHSPDEKLVTFKKRNMFE